MLGEFQFRNDEMPFELVDASEKSVRQNFPN